MYHFFKAVLPLFLMANLNAADPLQNTWGASQKASVYLAKYVEPSAHGEAAVALYEDDYEACYVTRVDGNWTGDQTFWRRVNNELGIPISFVLVSHGIPNSAWSPWDSVRVLYEAGNGIGSHSAYHNPYDLHADGTLNLYIEYHDSKDTIESKMHKWFPDYVCKSFAGPGGGWPNDGDSIRMYYNVTDPGQVDGSSDIRPIKEMIARTLDPGDASFYRGTIQFVCHTVFTQATRDEVWLTLEYAAANRERLWLPTREDAALYSAERKTHILSVSSVLADEIRFGLTDSLLDSVFTYPLTVKVCVDTAWDNMTAVQNGSSVDWFFRMENGRKYALVKAVPDQGEVVLSKTAPVAVQRPWISPRWESFRDSAVVTMVCATSNAEIRYTTDGSDPTATSARYTGPVTLFRSAPVKARGFKTGLTASAADSTFITVVPDTVPARVTAAAAAGVATQIIVSFNEKVTAATAEMPGNYTVSGGISVSAAELLANGMAANLTVSALTKDQGYTVSVAGLADMSGNVMPRSDADFTYTENGPEANLQGYWTFDEAAGIQAALDHSGNGNTGVFFDGATTAPGTLGYALKLDGDDDLMNIGRSTFNFGATDELTIAFWFKYTENWIGNFANSQDYTKPYSIAPHASYKQVRFTLRTGPEGSKILGSSSPFTRDTWYHCTCTYKDSVQSIYLNGILDKTMIRNGGLVTSSSEDLLGLGFKGYMDEIRYYDRGLSAAEVAALMDVPGAPVCAAPSVSPAGSTYTDSVEVTLACATAGAEMYYTLDGTDPDMNAVQYAGPVMLGTGTVTLKAVAYAAGSLPSSVSEAMFTVAGTPADPVITPAGGIHGGSVEVTMSCATPGATVYYTTDGSTPDTGSAYYESPLTFDDDVVIKAVAYSTGLASGVVEESFTITTVSVTALPDVSGAVPVLPAGSVYTLQGRAVPVSQAGSGFYLAVDPESGAVRKVLLLK